MSELERKRERRDSHGRGQAAWDAAWAAAWAAARDAAWDAAREKLAATVTELQASAVDLVKRMCALTKAGAA